MTWTKHFCETCGIVTRHDQRDVCQDCQAASPLPLAPIEDGHRDRPVIKLQPCPSADHDCGEPGRPVQVAQCGNCWDVWDEQH